MPDEFTTSAFIPALPMAVYLAWLDAARHSEMTGADAHSDARPGGAFDAWDGYIHGTTVELEPGRRIVQRWRTAEFPGDAPDSVIELTMAPEGNGTRLKIKHTGIPEGQGQLYESGWADHYFRPMQEYFIHAGISGVPAGASVTEILHRVSTGQASPSSPSLPVFRDPPAQPDGHMGIQETDDIADAPEPVQVVEEHEPTGNTDFELAEDNEEDTFDTTQAPAEQPAVKKSTTEDFWKHLDKPAERPRPRITEEPLVDEFADPGPRPARRIIVGAGKPRKSNNTKGRKKAARPGQSRDRRDRKEAAKPKKHPTKKKAAKAKTKSPKPKRRVSKHNPKKAPKKQIKARRVSGGVRKAKPRKAAKAAARKPAKKASQRKPAKAVKAKKKPATKRPARKKPAPKKKSKARKKK